MMELKHIEDKEMLVSIWTHETYRVFRDRLINQKDRDKFNELAHARISGNLDMDWELKGYKDLLFGDFENPARAYLKLSEVSTLIPRLDQALDLHNSDNSPMNLVFFSDCIQHLARITRVLRQSRGNLLLVGVGGSGRRSMAKLGAHMQD